MSDQQIEKLIELIENLVNEEGSSWKEKRDRILKCASDRDQTSLKEFSTWFGD